MRFYGRVERGWRRAGAATWTHLWDSHVALDASAGGGGFTPERRERSGWWRKWRRRRRDWRCRLRILVSVARWLFRSHGFSLWVSPPTHPTTKPAALQTDRFLRARTGRNWETRSRRGADARTGCEETREGVREGRGRFMWSILGRFLIQTYEIKRRPFVLNEGNQTFVYFLLVLRLLLFIAAFYWNMRLGVSFYGSHMLSAWLSAPAGVHR